MSSRTFLTHRAHMLLEVAKNPDATVQQLADEVGISTRLTVTILDARSVTEEIRFSLQDWIERSKSDPQVLTRAETIRACSDWTYRVSLDSRPTSL
ncbi:MAG: hypothetical protein LH471_03855 [Salinibacterium sp.]|nr:hypothetical protein [Salinibacterium sp.]